MIQPIVLAAGMGTRMGASKAAMLIDGVPALARILTTLSKSRVDLSPIVVLGKHALQELSIINLDSCRVEINPHPETGMSDSLKLALDAVDAAADGILLFLVDMPLIRSTTIDKLVDTAAGGVSLAAPQCEGQRGFPVFFSRAHLAPLRRSLTGDRGGRDYLSSHAADVQLVPVSDRGCIIDIDQPSDLNGLKGEHSALSTRLS